MNRQSFQLNIKFTSSHSLYTIRFYSSSATNCILMSLFVSILRLSIQIIDYTLHQIQMLNCCGRIAEMVLYKLYSEKLLLEELYNITAPNFMSLFIMDDRKIIDFYKPLVIGKESNFVFYYTPMYKIISIWKYTFHS